MIAYRKHNKQDWLEITLLTQAPNVTRFEQALSELGAQAITLRDSADDAIYEPHPEDSPLWVTTQVTGLFDTTHDQQYLLSALADRLGPQSIKAATIRSFNDRPWEREWLVYFKPQRYGMHLWVAPSGYEHPDGQSAIVRLDPGLAFGTGTHPTTAMCLTWLDQAQLDGKTVIDYGCGSGILSIAAIKLGAQQVTAVDHDPQALLATTSNATANKVSIRLSALAPDDLATGAVDILLANILSGTLIGLARTFSGRVKPGGHIILSGILHDQCNAVKEAYTRWFTIDDEYTSEEWVLLVGRRRPALR
ncbi:MAG: 50S ribosomal protein L11 methyltransferase [Gammaproteobacteria bacterium]|nr:MAG: 50S ribosomal protein L11 methyltransferase [Gammaproteobacteria bacterium]